MPGHRSELRLLGIPGFTSQLWQASTSALCCNVIHHLARHWVTQKTLNLLSRIHREDWKYPSLIQVLCYMLQILRVWCKQVVGFRQHLRMRETLMGIGGPHVFHGAKNSLPLCRTEQCFTFLITLGLITIFFLCFYDLLFINSKPNHITFL